MEGAATASSMASPLGFKCLSLMRHSIAIHNEAAASIPDAIATVYMNEAYYDASLSHAGQVLVLRAREALVGLSPPPDVVFCSPLTRTIQTSLAMFEGTGIRIFILPEVREAYGRFPCDRHRDKRELEAMFGDAVDFSLCTDKDTLWSADSREEMTHLNNRVAGFLNGVLRREEGHVFVVSHGVFMETAIRQITAAYPQYHTNKRVHNCEVHTFVLSLPSAPAPPSVAAGMPLLIASSTPFTQPLTPLVIGASTAQANPDDTKSRFPNAGVGNTPVEPQLEAYLTGEALALACASSMPLPAVAHANRILYRYAREGDGYSLTEASLYRLFTRCGLAEQEMKWVVSALDGEGYGKVSVWDVLLALVVFYPGHRVAAAAATTAGGSSMQQVGLREFKMRYQRQLYGTPLSNLEVLEATFGRILSAVLAIP